MKFSDPDTTQESSWVAVTEDLELKMIKEECAGAIVTILGFTKIHLLV